MVIFLPAVFFTKLAFSAKFNLDGGMTFGRPAFIVALGSLAVSFYRILHPNRHHHLGGNPAFSRAP
jgi:hypothetical protein